MEIQKKLKMMEQVRKRKKKQRERINKKDEINVSDTLFIPSKKQKMERNKNIEFHFASDDEFIQATKEFDRLNEQLVHNRCTCCRKVRLDMKVEQQTFRSTKHSLCYSCKHYNLNEIKQVQRALPIWKNDNQKIQFQLPNELMDLREGEKLMIQKYSAYVPIHHLYKGQIGAKGHCCAFKQNIMDVSLVLPRKPADIKFIQVIKKYKDKSGDIGEKNSSFGGKWSCMH